MMQAAALKVMIAGVGGASLGTELLKCLVLAGGYEIFGCDISPTAYGLYEPAFKKTYRIDRESYIASVIAACTDAGANWLVPGGEQPMVLLCKEIKQLDASGIRLVANHPDVINTFSDKSETFRSLSNLGFAVPRTTEITSTADIERVGIPCIVKPATGSGGSAMVFFAADVAEAETYSAYIRRDGGRSLAQEYISPEEGEFTVGVLSLPNGKVAGSIALRRSLDSKLSVLSRGQGGLISSGYSQGYIGSFPEIRAQAEAIASAIGSRGPLNIQGRVREGRLIPFEINPRLSASSYLRAMAGFNEIDIFLRYMTSGQSMAPKTLREGWYLRSLTETYVAAERIKS